MTLSDRVRQVMGLVAEATPGEWKACDGMICAERDDIAETTYSTVTSSQDAANEDLICAAVNFFKSPDGPALVAALEDGERYAFLVRDENMRNPAAITEQVGRIIDAERGQWPGTKDQWDRAIDAALHKEPSE